MKVKALLFVIFTICLFSFGVLITTLFNTAPTTNDAVAMFYASLSITLFGVIFFLLMLLSWLQTHVSLGFATLMDILRLAVIIDVLIIALLALEANNVLNWATSVVLVVLTVIVGVVIKRRNKS